MPHTAFQQPPGGQYQPSCLLFISIFVTWRYRRRDASHPEDPTGEAGVGSRRSSRSAPPCPTKSPQVRPPPSHFSPACWVGGFRCLEGSKIMLAIYLLIKKKKKGSPRSGLALAKASGACDAYRLSTGTAVAVGSSSPLSSRYDSIKALVFLWSLLCRNLLNSVHQLATEMVSVQCVCRLQTSPSALTVAICSVVIQIAHKHTQTHTSQGSSMIIDLWIIE